MDPILTTRCLAIVSTFEGGAPLRYATLACIKGDSGELSIGYLQASLTSGHAGELLRQYYNMGGRRVDPSYITRAEAKDHTLDHDPGFRAAWASAAADPIMHADEDKFFSDHFLKVAEARAAELGVTEPLGICVIFDSLIHGAFQKIAGWLPPGLNQWDWTRQYVTARHTWLSTNKNPVLRHCTYRTQFFMDCLAANNWKLDLPLKCHGVAITV